MKIKRKLIKAFVLILIILSVLFVVRYYNVNQSEKTYKYLIDNFIEEIDKNHEIVKLKFFPLKGLENYSIATCNLHSKSPCLALEYNLSKVSKYEILEKLDNPIDRKIELKKKEMKINHESGTTKFENSGIRFPLIFNNTFFKRIGFEYAEVNIIEFGELNNIECNPDYNKFESKYTFGFLENEKSIVIWLITY